MPETVTAATADLLPWKIDPSVLSIVPLNLWALALLVLFTVHLWLCWRFLEPDKDGVKRYLYELVSSIDGHGRERADLRKLGACFFMLLASFIIVRGALVGGADLGLLAQVFGFVAVLLAIGLPAASSKAATEIGVAQAQATAQAEAAKVMAEFIPKPVQKTEIVNDASNPVITQDSKPVGADVPLPGQ